MRLPPIVFGMANRLRRAYWFLLRPKRFGVKVLLVREGNVLLVRHSYSGHWTLPGGGFNPRRESVEEASRREIHEELGIKLVNVTRLSEYESNREYKRDTVYCVCAAVESPEIRPSGEISDFRWFSKASLPTDLSTAAAKALQMLK